MSGRRRTLAPVHSPSAVRAVIALIAWGLALSYADTATEVEARAAGGERLVRLVRYRAEVERNAFAETLDLCAVYPLAFADLTGDRPPRLSWLRTFARGFAQPLGAFGLKGDYDAITRVHSWQFDAWFRSLHTIYLVDSAGFRRAAELCLRSTNDDDISKFAYAVIGMDIVGTLVAGGTLALPLGRGLIRAIAKAAPAWSNLARSNRAWSRLAKRAWDLAFVSFVPAATVRAAEYARDLRHAGTATQSFVDNGISQSERDRERSRRVLIARAATQISNPATAENFDAFALWARRNIDGPTLRSIREDWRALLARAGLNRADREYLDLLRIVLPALNRANLEIRANSAET